MGLQHMYQSDPSELRTFYANKIFLEQLHARADALVADPESASLFFVPLMLMQRGGNLW